MKNKLALIASSIILLTQAAFAGEQPSFPECPKINTIKAAGIKTVEQEEETTWYGYNKHKKFGTPYFWTLAAGAISADSEDEALDNANRGLSHLKFVNITPDYSCNYLAKTDDDEFDVQLILEDDANKRYVFIRH